MRVEVMWKRTLRSGGMLRINKKSKSVAREKTCVNEKQAHRKVSMQAVEIVKVDEFKYLRSTTQCNRQSTQQVKRKVEARWTGRRCLSGVICDRRTVARVKWKVHKVVVRPWH